MNAISLVTKGFISPPARQIMQEVKYVQVEDGEYSIKVSDGDINITVE